MKQFSNPASSKLTIIVDTNIFLSVFVFRGLLMRLVFELVLDKKITMFVSPALKGELKNKFTSFGVQQQGQDEVMVFIEQKGILITPSISLEQSRDKKDNFLLELSEAAGAEYLITRDKDLLDIHHWKQTNIIKPEDFLPLLRNMKLLG